MVREVVHARKRNPLSDLNKILVVHIPDVIAYAHFGEYRLTGLGIAGGGQSLPFISIDFDRRPYNNLAFTLTQLSRVVNGNSCCSMSELLRDCTVGFYICRPKYGGLCRLRLVSF